MTEATIPAIDLEKETQARLRRALGRRLVRTRGFFNQEEQAYRMGIHVNSLARYERGERLPTATFLKCLALHGVDIHWVLTGEVLPMTIDTAIDAYACAIDTPH